MSDAACRPFKTILIANRGEIACRVIETAHKLGYATVAVYSDADHDARHVQMADRAVRIGPSPVGQSYLVADAIIAAAKAAGADAVHPGYGFLAENADFAVACVAAGLVFIGPSAAAIRAMGNKGAAKRLMIAAGVPCVPGYQGAGQDDATLTSQADHIGYPIMVKAAAGGGGRGMRLVHQAEDFQNAATSARSEALGAFGSDELILEKAIIAPRHVEIQVFADSHGTTVHLGERDCSVQRRHQKVLEEAPCPVLSDALRAEMGAAAVRAAQSIGYRGAGTVEFLLDAAGRFYFLEMNTRIQVEHPVTEMVTGMDLVGLQIEIAAGRPLTFTQQDVVLNGHAIEARLYAEDPANGFLPQTGHALVWKPAHSEGVRIDHGLLEGAAISPYYDPMIAKIIAHGATREDARLRLIRALSDTVILGVPTNKRFLTEMLKHPEFANGAATTAFIETCFPAIASPDTASLDQAKALAAAVLVDAAAPPGEASGWWSTGASVALLTLRSGEQDSHIAVKAVGRRYSVELPTMHMDIMIDSRTATQLSYHANGYDAKAHYVLDSTHLYLETDGQTHHFEDVTYAPAETVQAGVDGVIRAPMNGAVRAVNGRVGERVTKGRLLLVIEAMKMEHQITAPIDAIVEAVSVEPGAQVATRQILITLRPV